MTLRPLTLRESLWIVEHGSEAVRTGKPVYVGHEQLEGWSAAMPFYLWYCAECRMFTASQPAGYEGRIECRARRREHRAYLPAAERYRQGIMAADEASAYAMGRLMSRTFYGILLGIFVLTLALLLRSS